MILTGLEILKQRELGKIQIDPFNRAQVNPNSYDFRLGGIMKAYQDEYLDPAINNPTENIVIPESGYVLEPSRIYLGHTVEFMGSDHFVPIIRGKSSVARLGLFIHVTADLIDIGSHNQWTLQLHVVQPLRLYPNMLIGQVTFWSVLGDVDLYSGKYQGSIGPIESMSYADWNRKEQI